MKIGGSICFQLIDIFEIIDDKSLTKDEAIRKIQDYQKSIITEGTGIKVYDLLNKMGYNGFFVFGKIYEMDYDSLVNIKNHVEENLSSLTCESEMKMNAIIAGYDHENHDIKYNFALADKVYNYAMKKSKAIRGHVLVWHKHEPRDVLNAYIEDRLGTTLDEYKMNNPNDFVEKRKELTKEFLGSYMRKIGDKYPNCYCFDVLNEIVLDIEKDGVEDKNSDGLRKSMWYEYLGEKYYIDVLELARENLPEGIKLFYNDYGEQNPEKRKQIINVINKIKEYEEKEGRVILDGIGLQSHYTLNITEKQIEEIYSDFSNIGKEVQVTEIDIVPGKNHKYDEKKFERLWKKEFECAQKYGIKSFTGWGIGDSLNWKAYTNVPITMVDKNGHVKDFAKSFIEKARNTQNISMENIVRNAILGGTTIESVNASRKVEAREKEMEEVTING